MAGPARTRRTRPARSPPGARREPPGVPAQYRTSMATLDDVARLAAELPEVTEGERHGNQTWSVAGKAFAWDRPFSNADIRRRGGTEVHGEHVEERTQISQGEAG